MSESFKIKKCWVVVFTLILCSLKTLAHDNNIIVKQANAAGDEIHNFTLSGNSSSFYSISGNLSTIKGTVNYEGLTLTQCLKIESNTSISYTTTGSSTLTLVFVETSPTIKIDGTNYTGSGGIITATLAAGNHIITKLNTANLFYISTKYNEMSGIQTLSSPANNNQTVICGSGPITPIVYTWGGSATDVVVTGLPVSGFFFIKNTSEKTLTIVGSTSVGSFPYSISTTGSTGTSVTRSGVITYVISPDPLVEERHNFTLSGNTNSFYSILGNLSTNKGTVTYNGLILTQCLKIESDTSISYTTPISSTLTLVFGETVPTIKVDGINYTGSGGIINVNLAAGSHTITKLNPANLFYINTKYPSPTNSYQTVTCNTAINPIVYAWGDSVTTVTTTGLPFSGISFIKDTAAKTIKISGTPTEAGSFPYTIVLTGGCKSVNYYGIITVKPSNTITLNSGNNSQTKCISTAITPISYSTTGATGATFLGLPDGVTGSFVSNTVTISGSPTVAGTFPYTITLTGGCGALTATGSINVTPDNTIVLTSATGTNTQAACSNTIITNITYATSGATGATFSGLPAGVTGSFASNTVTISGTPTVLGTYPYTITLTGGCGTVKATGSITIAPNNIIFLSSATGTNLQTACLSTAITPITYTTTGATGATFSGLPAGVTGSFASNVITISGTPTVLGVFPYSVTLTGGCGKVTVTGSITVMPNNTIVLSSATGTNSQTKCISTAITPISYATTVATGATFSGLPAGVTGSFASNVVTISGTPTVSGTFPYTITLTGGCGNTTATGAITVIPNNTIALSSATGTDAQTKGISTLITPITYTTTATGAIFSGLPAGVTGNFASNTITISGTPTVLGTFPYTIALTGGCGGITKTGSITVIAKPSGSITSGNSTQTVCQWNSISPISYSMVGITEISSVQNLPPGVEAKLNTNTVTISGIPTVKGTYSYSIKVKGLGGELTLTGIITVNENNNIVRSSSDTDPRYLCKGGLLKTPNAIKYTVSPGTTVVSVTGIPPGFAWNFQTTTLNIVQSPVAPIQVTGRYPYTITIRGVCGDTRTVNGSIIINENPPTLNLSSGTNTQAISLTSSIAPISYVTTGVEAADVSVTGLPAGVTGNWANNTFTISGTPTVAGTFNYTVKASGCGEVTKTGSIKVTAINNIITLSSAEGTNNQIVNSNTPITTITYSTTGATEVTVTGLPAGVTGIWNPPTNTLIISGTPTVSGVSPYTVTITGSFGTVTVSGVINVTNDCNPIIGEIKINN